MSHRSISGEQAEIDMVFVQEYFRICVNQYPVAILAENAGQFENVSPPVHEYFVLWRGPNQVSSVHIFVHHGSRKSRVLDIFQRLHGTPVVNLKIQIVTARESEKAREERGRD